MLDEDHGGFAPAWKLASGGEIGQGPTLPAFHRTNRVLNPY
jgi:hypothetical protein